MSVVTCYWRLKLLSEFHEIRCCVLQKSLSCKHEFRGNRLNDSRTSQRDVN